MPGTDRLDQLAAPKLVQVHRDHIRGRLPCTTEDVLDQRDDLGPERGRTTDDAEDGELRRTLRIQCSLTAGDHDDPQCPPRPSRNDFSTGTRATALNMACHHDWRKRTRRRRLRRAAALGL